MSVKRTKKVDYTQAQIDKATKECYSALSTARMTIRKNFPWYSTITYGLIPQMVPGLGTLGVSPGMVMIIDPFWYVDMQKEIDPKVTGLERKNQADAMRAGVVIHEVHHILRGMSRIESLCVAGEDPDLVNKAFDIPINDGLKGSSVSLPSWACYSDTFGFPEGKTGEQYLEMFKKDSKARKKAKSSRQVGSGMCGGCAGNSAMKELEEKFDKEIGRSSADKNRLRREGLKAISDASPAGCGSLADSIAEILGKGNEKPQVPWKSKARHILRTATGRVTSGRSDFSYRRPSRRSWTRGIIRPGMIDRKPVIFLVEDSSGSMGAKQLRHGRVEMISVFKSLGIDEAWFCDIDAGVAMEPKIISLRDLAKMPVRGRGGTNFCPGIEIAQKLYPRPELLIYFTDGDGPAPKKKPKNMEVIWCIVPTANGRRPAPWGQLILVSNDQKLREPYNW